MKLVGLMVMLLSFSAFAYDYDCRLMTDSRDTVKIQVTSKKMVWANQPAMNGTGLEEN